VLLTTLAFNLLGDGLRDSFEPARRRSSHHFNFSRDQSH
jgi:hypothetical protein